MTRKDLGISEAARQVPCAEGTLRRLDRQGVVRPNRDPWGRRLFGLDDVEAARKHLHARGCGLRNAGPAEAA
jgi:DNA-binding transcriptional MerR regulator